MSSFDKWLLTDKGKAIVFAIEYFNGAAKLPELLNLMRTTWEEAQNDLDYELTHDHTNWCNVNLTCNCKKKN